jgi:hypothetical protein
MRRALPALALPTLFFFGCQTVQVQAGPGLATLPQAPARVALAEPELDLWLEGSGQVTPQEIDQGLRGARAALASALEGRGFAPADQAEQVLVVRSQGVARTESRRNAQTAAVLGIVLVVAIIVVAIVASQHGDRGGGPRPAHVAGAPGRAGPRPVYPRPAYGYGPPAPWFGWGFFFGVDIHTPVAAPAPYPPVVAPTLESRLATRGYFAGDETEVALELHDARTGQILWSRLARDEVDPRDAREVRVLVDRMIGAEPWARPQPAPPRAPAAPAPAG